MDFEDIEAGDEISMTIEMDDDYVEYAKIDEPTHEDAADIINKQYDFPLYVAVQTGTSPEDYGYYCILKANGPAYLARRNDADDVEPVTMFAIVSESVMFSHDVEMVDKEETPFPRIFDTNPDINPTAE